MGALTATPQSAAAELLLRRRAARAGLVAFGSFTVPGYVQTRFHRFLAPYLEKFARGEIKRLMIFAPPQHGKSWMSSMLLPAWMFGQAEEKIILASYSDEKATDFGRDVRNLCQQPEYAQLFPGVKLADDSQASNRFNVLRPHGLGWRNAGSFFAVGKGGPITGRGATRAIVDDLIKNYEEAISEAAREKAWNWFNTVLMTRLAGDAAGVLILNTRWHEDDLCGRLLAAQAEGGEQWVVVSLPALANAGDLMGRAPGEALWPERFSAEFLQTARRRNANQFEALYQQHPTTPEGAILKRSDWVWADEVPTEVIGYIDSWDTAHKDKASNDFSARTTYAVTREAAYLVEVENERTPYPETKRRIIRAKQKRDCYRVLIEDKASGQDLIQDLQAPDHNGKTSALKGRIVGINPGSNDKAVRAMLVSDMQVSGRIRLWRGAPGIDAFVDQATAVPNGTHDDMVDSFTQFAKWYRDEFKVPAEYVLENPKRGRLHMEE